MKSKFSNEKNRHSWNVIYQKLTPLQTSSLSSFQKEPFTIGVHF